MTYFLFPEKLFVFFCLHPPQRPLSSGLAAERERERHLGGKKRRERARRRGWRRCRETKELASRVRGDLERE